jgi:hypothetical protein
VDEATAWEGPLNAGSNDWLLGENRNQVPGIQFELTRLPVVNWLTVRASLKGEVNPIAALGELMTHRPLLSSESVAAVRQGRAYTPAASHVAGGLKKREPASQWNVSATGAVQDPSPQAARCTARIRAPPLVRMMVWLS